MPMRTVAVCVCTYRRNGPLERLLQRLVEIGERATSYQLGVVVADDNPGGEARAVVERFVDRFALDVRYLVNGTQNISNGRNLVLAEAITFAEFAAMTDDDCLPDHGWIDALLRTYDEQGVDSVTGPLLVELAPGAASWITRERLFDRLDSFPADDVPLDSGQTNNCLIACDWLRRHPDHRFDPALGELGGEDMVFFRGAVRIGMRSHFSAAAKVHAIEPPEDLTLRALARTYFWLGNSEAVTNLWLESSTRTRIFLRGGLRSARAFVGPIAAMSRGRSPELRSALVLTARGLGVVSGALGARVRHH